MEHIETTDKGVELLPSKQDVLRLLALIIETSRHAQHAHKLARQIAKFAWDVARKVDEGKMDLPMACAWAELFRSRCIYVCKSPVTPAMQETFSTIPASSAYIAYAPGHIILGWDEKNPNARVTTFEGVCAIAGRECVVAFISMCTGLRPGRPDAYELIEQSFREAQARRKVKS